MSDSSRRQFLAGAATLSAAAAIGTAHAEESCSNLPPVVHKVYFWLKNPDSAEDREQLIAGLKSLGAINEVKGIHIGVPASTEQRDVVDNSYQVSELLLFNSAADQDAYQIDPIHEKFVEQCSHLWSKVVVYDSIAV
ncbi:Dabb family protein [Gilvimarinus agarilyticus]|uniref:Dabb family protein n=1 Tax=Gilvimarinus agarilyticus TaxID=679259 RepID=UPI00059EF356|nr:Dabb family protein [Gilvimarinus agarilyticus]